MVARAVVVVAQVLLLLQLRRAAAGEGAAAAAACCRSHLRDFCGRVAPPRVLGRAAAADVLVPGSDKVVLEAGILKKPVPYDEIIDMQFVKVLHAMAK